MAVLVVDIGGTFLRATAADASGDVLSKIVQPAQRLRSEDPIRVIADLVEDTRARSAEPVTGVVLGIPGILDRTRRTVVNAPNIKTLNGLQLADHLEKACRLPVYLDHDATLQTRGEALRGSAVGGKLVLGVYFGTGVGAAFLDRGRLIGGIYRMQIGHVPLRGEGRVGTGGTLDCVEAYASGVVLEKIAAAHRVEVEDIFQDRSGLQLQEELETFVKDQGLTVATAATLLDPDVIVIGGGIVDMTQYPFEKLVHAIEKRLSPEVDPDRIKIVRASLGPMAAIWGAKSIIDAVSKSENWTT